MNCIQDNKKSYWEQKTQQNNIIALTRTILNPCLCVITVTKVKKLRSVCKKNQTQKVIHRIPIWLIESDHDFILDEIKIKYTIEYEIKKVLMRGVNK